VIIEQPAALMRYDRSVLQGVVSITYKRDNTDMIGAELSLAEEVMSKHANNSNCR
jgi:hypothetical protein